MKWTVNKLAILQTILASEVDMQLLVVQMIKICMTFAMTWKHFALISRHWRTQLTSREMMKGWTTNQPVVCGEDGTAKVQRRWKQTFYRQLCCGSPTLQTLPPPPMWIKKNEKELKQGQPYRASFPTTLPQPQDPHQKKLAQLSLLLEWHKICKHFSWSLWENVVFHLKRWQLLKPWAATDNK